MVVGSVLGWAGVGFLTRCYQLGIQKRNIFDNFGGHAMLMTAFGAAGYYFHDLKQRQEEFIQYKTEQIVENRQRLKDKIEEKRAAQGEKGGH